MTVAVAVVPGVPALLPSYASVTDPVAELRSACLAAVSWLAAESARIVVLGEPQEIRVARSLLDEVGYDGEVVQAPRAGPAPDYDGGGLLVLANGSARRGEKAPGHLDERSFDFDLLVGAAVTNGDPAALSDLDETLGQELLASGIPALRSLGELGGCTGTPKVLYDEDPFGVQYWVVTWCAS